MTQFDLFAPEPLLCAGDMARQRLIDLARSEQVKAEVMAIYRAHPGEFLWFNEELLVIKRKYDLGSYFNDTIRILHSEGKLESRNVYFGAERPCSADLAGTSQKRKKGEPEPLPYMGYAVEYRAMDVS